MKHEENLLTFNIIILIINFLESETHNFYYKMLHDVPNIKPLCFF